jgi:hypothetical protein
MWWKSKVFLFSICLHLILLSLSTFSGEVRAEDNGTEGFIIEADRVVGSGVTATLVSQETSANPGKPMLRFQYEFATIYGMKLTKQVKSGKGAVSITLQANGPVTVKDMTVDVTEISFNGVCLKAGDTIPELGMDNIVMVAHYMNTTDSVIKQLRLNTGNGEAGVKKPGKLKVLEDLSMIPLSQLNKEIERITSGHLPLTCEQGEESVGINTDPIKDVIEVVQNPVDSVLDPLNPIVNPIKQVLEPLEPVLEPLKPILKPIKPVLKPIKPVLDQLDPILKPIEPVLKPIKPVVEPIEPILKPLEPVLKPIESVLEPIEPILEPITEPLEPVVGSGVEIAKTTCEALSDAKGVITKELALELIDEAIEKKVSLSSICQGDDALVTTMLKWDEDLLSSLGISDLLGKLISINPMEQLYKKRTYIEKQADGTVVFGG